MFTLIVYLCSEYIYIIYIALFKAWTNKVLHLVFEYTKLRSICLDSYMSCDIPFLIHGPSFVAITAPPLHARLSTRFGSVFIGIRGHSCIIALMRRHTDIGRERLAESLVSIGLRSELCAG